MIDNETIIDVIKKCRREQHLTQDQLAKKMGVSLSTVGRYETGITPFTTDVIKAFETALGVDFDEYLTDQYYAKHADVALHMPDYLCEYMALRNEYDFKSHYDKELKETVYEIVIADKEIPIGLNYYLNHFFNDVMSYADYKFDKLIDDLISITSIKSNDGNQD